MKKCNLFLLVLFSLSCFASDAFAGAGDEIFDTLAGKAELIGSGLGQTGFVIAGFGLAVFSFMALFNKISWKTLAYIMFSTFVLSIMTLIISETSSDNGFAALSYSSDSSPDVPGNVQSNPVNSGH